MRSNCGGRSVVGRLSKTEIELLKVVCADVWFGGECGRQSWILFEPANWYNDTVKKKAVAKEEKVGNEACVASTTTLMYLEQRNDWTELKWWFQMGKHGVEADKISSRPR